MLETRQEQIGEVNRLRAAVDIYRNRMMDYNGLLLAIHLENRAHQSDVRREMAALRELQHELAARLPAPSRPGLIQRFNNWLWGK